MGNGSETSYQISSSGGRRRRGRCTHFPEGSSVEVRFDEPGLQGAYFSATVIPPPATPISHRKRPRKQLYVEYGNLLADEEGSERLREYVDVSCVRPAPPALEEAVETDRIFCPDDVVDAFCKDGWWTGIVSRVVDDGKRAVVTFQNPPDELEFGLSDLRAHWDWVDGVWVKQQSAAFITSMYGVGRPVEISPDPECHRNVWIPAIIDKYLGNGVLSVEYMVNTDRYVMTKVDFDIVRPCPPVQVGDERKFVLSEKVDACVDFAWWSGVVSKVLENNRYIVFLNQIKQDREFGGWHLRPHMEWKDGKWLLQSFSDEGLGDLSFSASANDDRNMSLMKSRLHRSDSRAALKMLEEGPAVEDGNDHPIERVLCGFVNNTRDQSLCDAKNVRKRREVSKKRPHGVDQEPIGEEMIQVRRRNNELDDEQQPHLEWAKPEMHHSPLRIDWEKQKDGVVLDDDYNGRQTGSALVHKGSCSSIQSNKPQNLMPCVQKKTSLELQILPFVKKSKLWEAIKSMEVFKRIPQKPHFQPLEEFKEGLREGMAIGYTIAFGSLVKEACGLKCCDPKTTIDDMIESLGDLERYGFDVGIVRDGLMKLLGLKAKHEKLLEKVNKLNKHIEEHEYEEIKIVEEIQGMKEQIKILQEKLLLAESAKEKEEDEIASLQDGVKETAERIKIVECDFESIISSICSEKEGK